MLPIDEKEIQEYYLKPFDCIGEEPYLSYAMLFPHDPPSTSYPSKNENEEKALIRGVNALFRFTYCDLLFTSMACPYDERYLEDNKSYSLTRCMDMIMHQHNPLYTDRIDLIWHVDQAWITNEGQRFYNQNKDNLLEALTKRFEDYGVGFEKGYILQSPETPPKTKPTTIDY